MTWPSPESSLPRLPEPVSPDAPVALRGEGLRVVYPDGTLAVDGCDIEVRAGERLGVIGPNGAGKSSLLLALAGLVPLAAGRVTLGERQEAPASGDLGILFQNPDDQLFCTTVGDDVAFGPRNQRLDEETVTRRVRRAMEAVGFHDPSVLCDRPAHHLSLGQRQAVALAAVLAMEPSILALDEPTSALDPHAESHLLETLQRLEGAQILVTQNLYLAARLCSRLAVMDRGCVVRVGLAPDILTDRALLAAHRLEFGLHAEIVRRVEEAAARPRN